MYSTPGPAKSIPSTTIRISMSMLRLSLSRYLAGVLHEQQTHRHPMSAKQVWSISKPNPGAVTSSRTALYIGEPGVQSTEILPGVTFPSRCDTDVTRNDGIVQCIVCSVSIPSRITLARYRIAFTAQHPWRKQASIPPQQTDTTAPRAALPHHTQGNKVSKHVVAHRLSVHTHITQKAHKW